MRRSMAAASFALVSRALAGCALVSRALAGCALVSCALAGCGLDLSGTLDAEPHAGADAGADGAPRADAGFVTPDASVPIDAGPDAVVDAGTDAPVTSPCTGAGGPTMVAFGAECIDSTEVTNAEYAAFLAANVDVSAQRTECAWNTSFTPSKWQPAPGRDSHPVRFVDFCDAVAFCAWAGKRLCGAIGGGPLAPADVTNASKSTWYRACSQDGAQIYPYGQAYADGACNVHGNGDDDDVAVGMLATCEGGYPGIFDLVGNVSEWQDACDGTSGAADNCVVQGDSHQTGSGSCAGTALRRRDSTYAGRGFRCCK